MDDRRRLSLKRSLVARRHVLLARRTAALAQEQELLEAQEPDWQDVAANRAVAAVLERLTESELVQLRRLEDAIGRLDRGTYGRCVICGSPIEDKRLRFIPEVDRCLGCTNHH